MNINYRLVFFNNIVVDVCLSLLKVCFRWRVLFKSYFRESYNNDVIL